MTAILLRETALAVLLAGLVGCAGEAIESAPPGPGPGPGGPGPMGGPGGGPPGNPAIKQIMTKLTKGSQSLTARIGKELDESPPRRSTRRRSSRSSSTS